MHSLGLGLSLGLSLSLGLGFGLGPGLGLCLGQGLGLGVCLGPAGSRNGVHLETRRPVVGRNGAPVGVKTHALDPMLDIYMRGSFFLFQGGVLLPKPWANGFGFPKPRDGGEGG